MNQNETVKPIFVSAADAATILAISRWQVYQLLDAQAIESRYIGKRRQVVLVSLEAYAASLPTSRPVAS